MDNQDNNIYNRFKQAADKRESDSFPQMESIWNRVEEKLDNKKQRRIIPWYKYAGVAAMLLLCLTIGTYIFRDNNTTPAIPENNVTTIDYEKIKQATEPAQRDTFIKEEIVVNESGPENVKKLQNTKSKYYIRTAKENIAIYRDTKSMDNAYEEIPVSNNVKFTKSKDEDNSEYRFYTRKITVRDGDKSQSKKELVSTERRNSEEFKIKGEITPKEKSGIEQLKEQAGLTSLSGTEQSSKSNAIESIEDRANASVLQSLQGQVQGLQIQSGSGQPGADSTIILRGISSINGNVEPLFVIDGLLVDALVGEEIFRSFKKNKIKSFNVLKNEAATSIYGNRGANGVIIIETKMTRKEKRKFKTLIEQRAKVVKENTINFKPIIPESNDEEYESFIENQFENPKTAPLSTFSIDVDNASYTNIRRFLNEGQTVPKDAVRVEEMINFFKYDYPQPKGNEPFSINTEYSDAPWNPNHKLLKIGLKGREIASQNLPASNFVFLIDVSGSMSESNKLPLLKQSMKLLVNQMRKQDRVAIVVYAGAAGLVLPSTSGSEKEKIIAALENLNAGGSTAGGEGIELAYKTAQENFIKKGNNRVILATDGDFNVGASSNSDMETLIEEKRKSGVFLTCLGYGMGNYKDSKMEILSDKGNGNYAYIDNMQEATRFLDKEFKGSMYAIAKDVKIQIEFNPKHVQSYRLIGYENRKLRDEDFVNDAIDAGELGSGHTVTALYEIIPVGTKSDYFTTEPQLKYSTPQAPASNYNDELATIKFRHKKPDEDVSKETIKVIPNTAVPLQKATGDFMFAASVAWFGLKLRDSKLVPDKTTEHIKTLAKEGLQNDPEGYRTEFIRLVEMVK